MYARHPSLVTRDWFPNDRHRNAPQAPSRKSPPPPRPHWKATINCGIVDGGSPTGGLPAILHPPSSPSAATSRNVPIRQFEILSLSLPPFTPSLPLQSYSLNLFEESSPTWKIPNKGATTRLELSQAATPLVLMNPAPAPAGCGRKSFPLFAGPVGQERYLRRRPRPTPLQGCHHSCSGSSNSTAAGGGIGKTRNDGGATTLAVHSIPVVGPTSRNGRVSQNSFTRTAVQRQ